MWALQVVGHVPSEEQHADVVVLLDLLANTGQYFIVTFAQAHICQDCPVPNDQHIDPAINNRQSKHSTEQHQHIIAI